MNQLESLFQPLAKGPISEIIVQRISDALISGELKPGDRIPTEQEFSEKLLVSRNAVREAIKVLVAFGVLEIRRSEGTFVVEEYHHNLINPLLFGLPLTEKSTKDILEFKASVYQSLLYFGAIHASMDELSALRAYCDEFYAACMAKPANTGEIFRTAEQYNRYLGEITHNPLLIQLNNITMRFAKYTRVKAIEVSLERNTPQLLPEAYYEDIPILERRDLAVILPHVENRLQLWKDLIL